MDSKSILFKMWQVGNFQTYGPLGAMQRHELSFSGLWLSLIHEYAHFICINQKQGLPQVLFPFLPNWHVRDLLKHSPPTETHDLIQIQTANHCVENSWIR